MKKKSLVSAMFLVASATAANICLAGTSSTNSVEMIQSGRYTHVRNIPTVDQKNPLKVVVKTRIPQSVRTVRSAIEFLLARSGFTLADEVVLSEEAKILMGLPLPQIHRSLGPITLDEALQTLSGDAYELVVDPIHRRVTFELSSKFYGEQ